MHQSREKGFTLAELLIALALLGVIAAFTIPKVLQATGNSENSAKVKETISTLESGWYNLKMQNQFVGSTATPPDPLTSGLAANLLSPTASATLNVSASDKTNKPPVTVLPATTTTLAQSDCANYAGYVVFPSGVVVSGIGTEGIPVDLSSNTNGGTGPAGSVELICIDVNGAGGPNVAGSDIFYGNFDPVGDFPGIQGGVNAKNFSWGGVTGNTIYSSNATASAASARTGDAPANQAGFYLNNQKS